MQSIRLLSMHTSTLFELYDNFLASSTVKVTLLLTAAEQALDRALQRSPLQPLCLADNGANTPDKGASQAQQQPKGAVALRHWV